MKTTLYTTSEGLNNLTSPHARHGDLSLPLRVAERRLLLLVGDCLMLLVAGIGALTAWVLVRPDAIAVRELIPQYWPWLLGASAAWLALYAIMGGYNLQIAARSRTANPRILAASASYTLAYLLLFFVFSVPPHTWQSLSLFAQVRPLRALPMFFSAGALIAVLVWRNLYIYALANERLQRRVLVVGAGRAGVAVVEAMGKNGDGGYQPVGYIDDDPDKLHTIVTTWAEPAAKRQEHVGVRPVPLPLRVLGDRYALKELILSHGVSTLILAISHDVDAGLLSILIDCLELGVDIIPMPLVYEELTGRVPVEHIGENWKVAIPLHHPGTGTLWPLCKRLIDIALAAIGVICLVLLLPAIATAIYLDTRGPVFYAQERVGKGGRIFRIYKFRSMVADAENGRALWAQEHDPRITLVGKWLRRTHLDELPQFVNILKGDMSVVGPRPERPEFVKQLAEDIPFYRVRHAIRPGATGWGQVRQGYGASTTDALLKLEYDLYYIKHQSLWLDLVILFKTLAHICRLRGR